MNWQTKLNKQNKRNKLNKPADGKTKELNRTKQINKLQGNTGHRVFNTIFGNLAVNICYGRKHPQNWMMYGGEGSKCPQVFPSSGNFSFFFAKIFVGRHFQLGRLWTEWSGDCIHSVRHNWADQWIDLGNWGENILPIIFLLCLFKTTPLGFCWRRKVLKARNAAIANSFFTCAVNRVGTETFPRFRTLEIYFYHCNHCNVVLQRIQPRRRDWEHS